MDDVAEFRDRGGLAVTVGDAEALQLYDDAVDAFAAGTSCALLIEQCLERVPRFALGRACEALVTGGPPRWSGWPPATAGLTPTRATTPGDRGRHDRRQRRSGRRSRS